MKARCSWCQGRFVKIDPALIGMLGEAHYWCETLACRERQAQHSLTFRETKSGRDDIFYLPLPKQVEFDCAPVRNLLAGGAAGASKSHSARYALYRRAFAIPGFEALILRRTWGELEKHHLRLMAREALKLRGRNLPVEFSKTDREFRVFHKDEISTIEGGHMENPDDVDKYLSRERDAIACDEGSGFDPHMLLALSTRARSVKPAVADFCRRLRKQGSDWDPPGGGAVFWVLSNPGGPASSMLRDFFIDHTPDLTEYPVLGGLDSDGLPMYDASEWGYVPGNLEDNPYLPTSYERDLAVLQPWRYQQLRYNNWDIVAGQFFGDFDTRIHVKSLGPLTSDDVLWFRSMDYGFIDPNVTLWWALLPDGLLHIKAEQRRQYETIPKLAKEIRMQDRLMGVRSVRYHVADKYSMGARTDDASDLSRADTFRECGIVTTTTTQDRELGWTRCHELLVLRADGRPHLSIDPSCRGLVRAISAAVSDPLHPEDIKAFRDDHYLDALRIGAMSRPAPGRWKGPPLPPQAVGHLLKDVQRRQPTGLAWRS